MKRPRLRRWGVQPSQLTLIGAQRAAIEPDDNLPQPPQPAQEAVHTADPAGAHNRMPSARQTKQIVVVVELDGVNVVQQGDHLEMLEMEVDKLKKF